MSTEAIRGVELYYEDVGSGPPLLFHHGFAGSHDSWERVIPLLSDRYRCVAMDCRGAGDSGHAVQSTSPEAWRRGVSPKLAPTR